MQVVFSHGMESGPWGDKITALAADAEALGFSVASLDYRGMADPQPRIDKLLAHCGELNEPYLLVGSSMGAYVALCAAQQLEPAGLFLLAPAFGVPGWPMPEAPRLPAENLLIHGWNDEVIPWRHSLEFAETNRAALLLLDDSHRLTVTLERIREEFRIFLQCCEQL